MDKSSMLYWYPRIKDLEIPRPRTMIVPVRPEAMAKALDGDVAEMESYTSQFFVAADKVGYPLFLRTDYMAAKHQYRETCFVPGSEALLRHIGALVHFNFMAAMFGPDPSALVFREFIPLYAAFKAFEGLPIAPERRYFVEDGEVVCHHPYWPADSIQQPSRWDWTVLLARLNKEGFDEINLLSDYARAVSAVLPGFWSVDFALAAPGETRFMYGPSGGPIKHGTYWLLIDCAEGEKSWHPDDCEHKRERPPLFRKP